MGKLATGFWSKAAFEKSLHSGTFKRSWSILSMAAYQLVLIRSPLQNILVDHFLNVRPSEQHWGVFHVERTKKIRHITVYCDPVNCFVATLSDSVHISNRNVKMWRRTFGAHYISWNRFSFGIGMPD